MRTLKELDTQYGGEVAILAIGTDPSEGSGRIRSFRDNSGYSWPMAEAHRDVIVGYGVTSQSTKVAIGRDGVIRFREGYGTKSQDWWENVFTTLAQQ